MTLREDYELRFDGDAWGCAMSFWFDIAEHLHATGEDVPAEWDFEPSALGTYTRLDFLDYTADELVEFGNVLERYTRMLRAAGRDY